MRTRKKSGSSTKALGDALGDLIQSLGIEKQLDAYEAVTRWEEIVGPRIGHISTPTGIEKGVLVIKVSNGPWRNELTLLKQDIIDKINAKLGKTIVRDIRFV